MNLFYLFYDKLIFKQMIFRVKKNNIVFCITKIIKYERIEDLDQRINLLEIVFGILCKGWVS